MVLLVARGLLALIACGGGGKFVDGDDLPLDTAEDSGEPTGDPGDDDGSGGGDDTGRPGNDTAPPDADGDGWPDGDEPDDLNGDGIPAYLDPDEHPEEVTLYGTFRGGVGACATAPAAGLLPVLLALLSVLRLRTSPRAPTPPRAPPAAAGSRSVPARGGHTGGCAPATTGRDRRGQTAR